MLLQINSENDEEINQLVYNYLWEKQETEQRTFPHDMPYWKVRKVFISWIFNVGRVLTMSQTAQHLAVRFMDYTLTNCCFPKTQRQLVACGCVLVASKYWDLNKESPSLEEMETCVNSQFSQEEIRAMEIQLLFYLDWKLDLLVPLQFIPFLLQFCLSGCEEQAKSSRLKVKMATLCANLCHECLEDYRFQSCKPALLAAAILGAARRHFGIYPIWNSELETITHYSFEAVSSLVQVVWKALFELPFERVSFAKAQEINKGRGSPTDIVTGAGVCSLVEPESHQSSTTRFMHKPVARRPAAAALPNPTSGSQTAENQHLPTNNMLKKRPASPLANSIASKRLCV
eukprot:GCRY01000091.1.p1 GENE.GCRY01000091.1~~GCRY01000091.1.p1  ORF type:complete len:344 (+),score=33.90 GCRY01000091.1:200-1231(+)